MGICFDNVLYITYQSMISFLSRLSTYFIIISKESSIVYPSERRPVVDLYV